MEFLALANPAVGLMSRRGCPVDHVLQTILGPIFLREIEEQGLSMRE